MLVHICCSVDSHFFLSEIKKIYPNEKIIAFFYDPNIHPYGEYRLRLLDVKRSCKKLEIELIEGDYDYNSWIEAVRGLENEPEKGKRCEVCFDNRLEETAKKAKILHENLITTTLFVSPKKSFLQLQKSASSIEKKYNLKVLTPDFRKNGGTQRQFELAKKDKLYHQNYCGCIYALSKQREAQKKLLDELMCCIGRRVLPQSIEERLDLYESIKMCEENGINFALRKERFLNYRLLSGLVRGEKKVIPSYILFYSFMKKSFVRGKIEEIDGYKGYFNRDGIIFLELIEFNYLADESYSNVKELIFDPPVLRKEILARKKLSGDFFSLSPIIVVNKLPKEKLEIVINSYIYDDVRELLAIKG